MIVKLKTFINKAENIGGGAVCAITGIMMAILTLTSFLFTSGMEIVTAEESVDTTVNRIFPGSESVVYYSDPFILNVVVLILAVLLCRLMFPAISKLKLRHMMGIITIWTVGVGLFWVTTSQVCPTYDSARVSDFAFAFAQGDLSGLSDEYLTAYPFQLGFIQLCEIIYRIAIPLFHVSTTIVLQAANVLFLAAAYVAVLGLTSVLFSDSRVCQLTFVLLLFCAQPILSCSFVYGLVPGICFAAWAIYLQALWFKHGKLIFGLLSAVSIGLAALIKSNNLIILIAMLIIAALRLIKRRNYVKDIAVMLAMCVCAFSFSSAVQALYEKRSGIETRPGMPYVSWIAMGLSESVRAPGWYSQVTSKYQFESMDSDVDAFSDYSKEIIKERVSFFAHNPQYARDFFYRKYVSQFNETTYQSIWNNEVRDQYAEKRSIAAWVCGDGEAAAERYMDLFSQIVFAGMLAALAVMLRRRDYGSLILPLSVLGGMMFHLLAEGKSQYILPYFVLMLPSAAFGLTVLADSSGDILKKIKLRKKASSGEGA